ncbi:uncharacterized protein C8A04DRAFT_26099 [Dichotomopilus funicola]|uniref:Uncharacterized protein n=1 Tax=Dichotomopilus funicola TaxID=1934379 RepID=A0AAN6ZNL5_9PEZI|nr:hypothetical protein C8A04DRAFT_26099 [Dichotomopilus funicola]
MSGIPGSGQKRPRSLLEEQGVTHPRPKVLLIELSTIIEGKAALVDCLRMALTSVLIQEEIPLFTGEELYRECYLSPLVFDMMKDMGIRELSDDEELTFAKKYFESWQNAGLPLMTLCNGAREFLEAAKAQESIKVAILSNNVPVAKSVLEMLGVEHLVDNLIETHSYEAHRTTDGESKEPAFYFWSHWYHVVVKWFDRITGGHNLILTDNIAMDAPSSQKDEHMKDDSSTVVTTVIAHANPISSQKRASSLHPSEVLLVSRAIYDFKIVAHSGMQTCWLHDIDEAADPETNAVAVNDSADTSKASGGKTPLTVQHLIAETNWSEQEKKENRLRRAQQYRAAVEKIKSEVDFTFSELDELTAFVFGADDRSATASLRDDNEGEIGVAPVGVAQDQQVVVKSEEDDGSVMGLSPIKDDQVVVIEDNDSDDSDDEVLFIGETKVVTVVP